MKPFKIPVDIYRTNVHVMIGLSKDESIRYYKKYGGDYEHALSANDNTEARCICDKSGLVFIVLKEDYTQDVVVHELLHAVFYILSTRGLSLEDASEEAYTYLMGYLMKQFLIKTNKL